MLLPQHQQGFQTPVLVLQVGVMLIHTSKVDIHNQNSAQFCNYYMCSVEHLAIPKLLFAEILDVHCVE